MTSEAVGEDVDPTVASPALVALVAKREQELKGKPETPAAGATKAKETEDANAGSSDAGQAEEVEAGSPKDAEAPDEGKPDAPKKTLDVEWAKSDALKRRISALHEAGHLDDDLLGLMKDGANAKEIRKGANTKFEAAAEKVKAANTERDQYRERAERYDRLMSDPKFHAALHATEDEGEDESLLTPEEKRLKRLEKDLADIKSEKRTKAETDVAQKARIREIEGWAEDHKESLNGTVSDGDYESALGAMLTEMLEDDLNPRDLLTQRGLTRKVNRVLERQREEKDVQGLRERVEGSKRDVVRSARASSPAGVRTEVGKTFPSTPQGQRQKRIAETLEKYPLRPE